MDHAKKVFMAVKSLFEGERVLVVCASRRGAETFFLECVKLLAMLGTRGEVTVEVRHACKTIVKGAGRLCVTELIRPGTTADVVVLDDGMRTVENLCDALGRDPGTFSFANSVAREVALRLADEGIEVEFRYPDDGAVRTPGSRY